MLTGVSRTNEPARVVLSVFEQFQHLPRPELAGFIQDDDRSPACRTVAKQFRDGAHALKSCGLQVDDLLALRRDDLHIQPSLVESTANLPQGKALAGACAATEKGDEVARRKDHSNRALLFVVQRLSRAKLCVQWRMFSRTVSGDIEYFQFPPQHLAGRHEAVLFRRPQIIAPGAELLECGDAEVSATGVFQGMTPQCMFGYDGASLKKMLLRPLQPGFRSRAMVCGEGLSGLPDQLDLRRCQLAAPQTSYCGMVCRGDFS